MTIDESIKFVEEAADYDCYNEKQFKCAEECRQLADWLRELKGYREFADWLVKAVLEEDWKESADFYAEVICRKLTKLGKLKVVDNKYIEVNVDEIDEAITAHAEEVTDYDCYDEKQFKDEEMGRTLK